MTADPTPEPTAAPTANATTKASTQPPGKPPCLYRELADWYPLLTPVADYAEEAAFYYRLFDTHCRHPPRTLLDLGSGGGHNAAHLKARLGCMLVDLAPAMLALSRRLNPECEHVQADMRSVRLGRVFDCVLVHDAVCYMASRADLQAAIATAFEHTAPGGVALFQPDFVAETFEPGTETGGSDANGRGLRYLEWRWAPDSSHEIYLTDMAYLLRDENGAVEVRHDRHVMGLFSRAIWLDLIGAAGFEPLAVAFEHSSASKTGHEVFLGLRPSPRQGRCRASRPLDSGSSSSSSSGACPDRARATGRAPRGRLPCVATCRQRQPCSSSAAVSAGRTPPRRAAAACRDHRLRLPRAERRAAACHGGGARARPAAAAPGRRHRQNW